MLAELAAANAAFQVIKTAIKNSGEIFQKQARQRREDEERQRIKADLERKQHRRKLLETIMLTFWMIVLFIFIIALAGAGVYIAYKG